MDFIPSTVTSECGGCKSFLMRKRSIEVLLDNWFIHVLRLSLTDLLSYLIFQTSLSKQSQIVLSGTIIRGTPKTSKLGW
jgi:hypothetical protein